MAQSSIRLRPLTEGDKLVNQMKDKDLVQKFTQFLNQELEDHTVSFSFLRAWSDATMFFCIAHLEPKSDASNFPVNTNGNGNSYHQERIVRRHGFTQPPYTRYIGSQTNRFYKKEDWERQFQNG